MIIAESSSKILGPPGANGDHFAAPAPGPVDSQLSLPTRFSRRGFPGDPHAGPLGVGGHLGLGLGPLFDTPSYSTSKMKASRPQKSMNSLSKTMILEVIKGGSDQTPDHPSTDLGAGEE